MQNCKKCDYANGGKNDSGVFGADVAETTEEMTTVSFLGLENDFHGFFRSSKLRQRSTLHMMQKSPPYRRQPLRTR